MDERGHPYNSETNPHAGLDLIAQGLNPNSILNPNKKIPQIPLIVQNQNQKQLHITSQIPQNGSSLAHSSKNIPSPIEKIPTKNQESLGGPKDNVKEVMNDIQNQYSNQQSLQTSVNQTRYRNGNNLVSS